MKNTKLIEIISMVAMFENVMKTRGRQKNPFLDLLKVLDFLEKNDWKYRKNDWNVLTIQRQQLDGGWSALEKSNL